MKRKIPSIPVKLLGVATAAFISTQPALALSRKCSSADQSFSYTYSLPDSGVVPPQPIEAEVKIVLDGKDIPKELVSFTGAKTPIFSDNSEPILTSIYATQVTVFNLLSQVKYQDYVICKYIVKLVP